jgi:hypothetical protein
MMPKEQWERSQTMNPVQKLEFWRAIGLDVCLPLDANNFFKYVIPAIFAKTQGPHPIIITVRREKYDNDAKVAFLYERAAGYFVRGYPNVEEKP